METIHSVPVVPIKRQRTLFSNSRLTWKRNRRPQGIEHLIDNYWAGFLGCGLDRLLSDSTTHVMPVSTTFGFWAFSRSGGWVVTAPSPLYEKAPATIQASFLPKVLPNLQQLQPLFHGFAGHDFFGPAEVLLHKRATLRFPVPAYVRPVTAQDQQAVALFQAETPAIVWTLAAPETWIKVFGAFMQDRLVAACAVRVWGNLLAEIYVDTSPAYQRCGYGRAVTNAALNWIHAETPYIPESVVELTNQASVHLMKSLGFEPYGYMVTCCTAD